MDLKDIGQDGVYQTHLAYYMGNSIVLLPSSAQFFYVEVLCVK